MPMYINLEAYLSQLKALESTRPADQRRRVPTVTELAAVAGVHQTTMSRIAGNRIRQFNLDIGDAVISEMRRRGFDTDVNDIIVYVP